MDAYNCIFEANFQKINENCAKLPEPFRGEKFNAYFCGNFHRLSALSGRESRYFGEISSPKKMCLWKDWNFSHVCGGGW